MAKSKRKLTPSEKEAKARRKAEFMTIFVNGRQRRVPRPVLIEGLDPDEFIIRNADPIWLHQNGMWEYLAEAEENGIDSTLADSDDIPF